MPKPGLFELKAVW